MRQVTPRARFQTEAEVVGAINKRPGKKAVQYLDTPLPKSTFLDPIILSPYLTHVFGITNLVCAENGQINIDNDLSLVFQ